MEHFKVLKDRNFQPRILYPMKIALKNRDKIRHSQKKRKKERKPGEFVASRAVLKDILKKFISFEGKRYKKKLRTLIIKEEQQKRLYI